MEAPEGGQRSRATGVTRRRFVKGAAVGVAAAAGLVMLWVTTMASREPSRRKHTTSFATTS